MSPTARKRLESHDWWRVLIIEHVIQCPPLQSIPSRPPMARERAGYIFIIILDPEYVFSPPETPAHCTQTWISAPNIHSGDVYICLHIPASPRFTPLQAPPSYPAPTASKTPLPALKHTYLPLLIYPHLPIGVTYCYMWHLGNLPLGCWPCRMMLLVGKLGTCHI